jgi:hypothetical protein
MEWYYANDGQRQGPVSDEGFADRVAAGEVTATTLVWRAGMADWRPWGEIAPTTTLPEVPPAMSVVRAAPTDGEGNMAAAVASGEVLPPVDAETFWRQLQANGYSVSAGRCLSRAWDLYSAAFLPCLGVTLLAYLIMMVAANVPIIGIVAQFLVVPQLTAGLSWYFLRRVRGEPAELNDIFIGFKRGFGQLALVSLIQFLFVLPFVLLMMGLLAGAGFMTNGFETGGAAPPLTLIVVMAALGVTLALLMYRLMFAHIIVVDRGETAWAALKLSWRIMGLRYLTLLGLGLLILLISLAGTLALLIGLLFVLPLIPAAFAFAYQDAVLSAEGKTPAP